MRVIVAIAIVMLTAQPPSFLAQGTRDAGTALKAAQHKEHVEGDLKGAIEAYKSLVSTAGGNRVIAAQALMGLARCHQKLGDAEARAIYERVAREFSDQPAVVAEARAQLSLLTSSRAGQGLLARQLLRLPSALDNFVLQPDGRLGGTDWATGNLVIIEPTSGSITQLVAARFNYQPSTWGESPVIAPDQRQFAYSWFDGALSSNDLRVQAVQNGSKPRTILSKNGRYQNIDPLAWSPDGSSILVEQELIVPAGAKQPSNRGDFQLAWVSVATGAITPVKTFEWWRTNVMFGNSMGLISLSPDRQWIAYAAADREGSLEQSIWIIRADGTGERRIVRGAANEQPVWTPDGSRLVFVSNRSGSLALWSVSVVERGEAAPSLLKHGIGRIRLHGIASTGALIYSEEGGVDQLTVARVESPSASGGPALRNVDSLTGILPSWSPDGRYLAYKRRNPQAAGGVVEFVVRTLQTGAERVYTPTSGLMTMGRPTWHRDGTVQAVGLSSIRVRVDRAMLEEVSTSAVLGLGMASPDGRTVYGGRSEGVERFDVSSGARVMTSLPRPWRAVALSPDGQRFAVMDIPDPDGSSGRLGIINVDGSGLRELPTPIVRDVWNKVTWERDGSALVVGLGTLKDTWSIVRMPLDGTPSTVLAADIQRLRAFDVSPDGSQIAISTDNKSTEIWTLDLSSVLKTSTSKD